MVKQVVLDSSWRVRTGTVAGVKFSKYIDKVDQALLKLGMLLGFITLVNESGLVEEVEKQDALVTPPCNMVLHQQNTGAPVGEKCTRYMLEEKELENLLKVMMPLQSTTSMLSVGLDW